MMTISVFEESIEDFKVHIAQLSIFFGTLCQTIVHFECYVVMSLLVRLANFLCTNKTALSAIGRVLKLWYFFYHMVHDLTGVSPGEGTGATMSDDEDEQVDSDANLFDGALDGPDSMGFGPLIPTENERSLMERVRHELKHELKQVRD